MVIQAQTPPMPTSVGGIVISDNSYKVLFLRFLRKGSHGKTVEIPDEMLWPR
jgi:hypothetical protein